jgi:hypothetical protein
MPQQVGKFDFSGIAPAGQATPEPDFSGIDKAAPAAAPSGPAAVPASMQPFGVAPFQMLAEGIQSLMTPESLPMAGATVGGILGAPGIVTGAGGAALGGAAGEAGRQLLNRALGREAPGTMTEAATGIGTQGAIQGGLEAVGGGLTKGVSAAGQQLYRGYLKPALNQVDLPKAREIVATAIREALPISKGGEQRARNLIRDLNRQVNSLLQGASGGRIDLRQIANQVRAFANAKYNRPGVPGNDLEAALRVADEIDAHPSLQTPGGGRIVAVNPADANKVKQGLDTAVGDRAFGVERGAATEARKQGRHATRLAIEQQVPEVGPLNARESQIIDALEAVQHATGREENRNALFGVPSMLSGMAGAGYGASQHDPIGGALLALTTRGLLAPAVASRIAILATRFGKVPGTAPATAMRMAIKVALSEEQGQPPGQQSQKP